MLKLLFITPHGNLIYGGEKSLLLLLRELRERDVSVSVICPEPGVFVDALKAERFETVFCPLHNLTRRTALDYADSLRRFWGIVREFEPDIIHCNSASVAQIAIPVAMLHGIPVVVHLRNDLSCPEAKRYLVTKASAVIANSGFTGSELHACMDQRKRHVIYNPIQILNGNPMAQRVDNPMVLFVGQIASIKGVDTFVRIAAKLKYCVQKATFVLLGDEPYHSKGYLQEMKDIAEAMDVLSIIEFAGHVTNVEKYYSAASLVVVPSRKEPFGRVAAEAMMAGRPVVASRVGGLPEVVEDNVTGFLVEPDDATGFAEKAEYLLTHPDKANAMGQAGRERAVRIFSPQEHADKVMGVYRAVSR